MWRAVIFSMLFISCSTTSFEDKFMNRYYCVGFFLLDIDINGEVDHYLGQYDDLRTSEYGDLVIIWNTLGELRAKYSRDKEGRIWVELKGKKKKEIDGMKIGNEYIIKKRELRRPIIFKVRPNSSGNRQ